MSSFEFSLLSMKLRTGDIFDKRCVSHLQSVRREILADSIKIVEVVAIHESHESCRGAMQELAHVRKGPLPLLATEDVVHPRGDRCVSHFYDFASGNLL